MRAPADTIVALSSPAGGSPRAIVRLSGERAWDLAAGVFAPMPERGWRRTEGALTLPGWPPAPGAALGFRGPRSYTGEDMIELWVPGSPPLVRALLAVLEQAGARLADRGEFTRRAFLSGRLDLTQVEAVLALTTSEDARTAQSALRALGGGLGARIDAIKQGLLGVRAHVEAAIDFSEDDLDLTSEQTLAARLDALRAEVEALLAQSGWTPRSRSEPVVALCGPANAGKSSLFNALTGRDAALVSETSGTTRDVLEAPWTLPSGRVVRLLDTAGRKRAQGELEARALESAREAAQAADLVLWVIDGSTARPEDQSPAPAETTRLQWVVNKRDLPPAGQAESQGATEARAGEPALGVSDELPALGVSDELPALAVSDELPALAVSAVTGEGLAALGRAIDALFARQAPATDFAGSARQEGLLRGAREALTRAAAQLRGGDPARAELTAVDLGEALDALGALTGVVTTEAVLGEIFAGFCVGK